MFCQVNLVWFTALCLICSEVAMNILIPFGSYWLGWQQLRIAVRALGWLPVECTPACMPGAVAVRLLEQWKFIVICCSTKNNAVCIPRNFWKSQQICGWHLQPVKQVYGLHLGSAVKKGEAETPREAYASPANWWQSQLICKCGFSLSCPVSLGRCMLQPWDREGIAPMDVCAPTLTSLLWWSS